MQVLEALEIPSEDLVKTATILVIDDLPANVRLLAQILKNAGFRNVSFTSDPREGMRIYEELKPDLLLLDLNMPHLDGFEVMKQVKAKHSSTHVKTIVLTADSDPKTKHRALKQGARDFLTKPFDELEVLLRINNLLQTHFYGLMLEAKVRERTRDLMKAQRETLQRLSLAADYRDDNTGAHTRRVGRTSGLIADALGEAQEFVGLIIEAASLHDIGKIGISDLILLKPGKLTEEEFNTMKRHTDIGASILSGSSSPVLQLAEEIARYHHEFWNGNGYAGVSKEAIPLSGRIVAVADFFDALTHERPYKEAWPVEVAVQAVEERSGSQFDPKVVEAFMTLNHEELIH